MEIQILKENWVKALIMAAKFSAQKVQLPILSHALLEANREGIYLSATDLEVGVKLRIGGKVIEPGEVVLPIKVLSEYSGLLPLGVVQAKTIEAAEFQVMGGGMQANFQVLADGAFPQVLADPDGKWEELVTSEIAEAWRRLEFVVSKDLARPVLTGVRWETDRGRMVATDGYRLTVVDKKSLKFSGDSEPFLANGNFLGMAIKILQDLGIGKFKLGVSVKTKQMIMQAEDVVLVGRLLEGEFPNYSAILPQGEIGGGLFDKEALLQAVKGAMIFARDSAQIVKFDFSKIALKVEAATQQGEAITTLDGEMRGEEMIMAFNGRYVIDFLNHTTANRIMIGVDDPLKPGLFCEEGEGEFKHVIMPIRLRE